MTYIESSLSRGYCEGRLESAGLTSLCSECCLRASLTLSMKQKKRPTGQVKSNGHPGQVTKSGMRKSASPVHTPTFLLLSQLRRCYLLKFSIPVTIWPRFSFSVFFKQTNKQIKTILITSEGLIVFTPFLEIKKKDKFYFGKRNKEPLRWLHR